MGNTTVIDSMLSGSTVSENLPFLIGFVIGCLLAAFFSFRFFKLTIVVEGLVLGYTFGFSSLGMLLSDRITSFNAPLVLGIACALVFGILAPKFYKAMIYLFGGALGFVLAFSLVSSLVSSAWHNSAGDLAGIVVGIIAAVFVAKLVYRFFKAYIILTTSFLGSLLMTSVISASLFGTGNGLITTVFLILGVVLGVVSARAQFRMNRGRTLNL